MTAQIAFAALQASARNFAGLDNARTLILQAKHIRRQRYVEIAEEAKHEAARTESSRENPNISGIVSENITGDSVGQGMMLCKGLQQAA